MLNLRFILRAVLQSLAVAVVAYLVGFLLPKAFASSMSLYFPAAQQRASNSLAASLGAAGTESDNGTISNLNNAVSSPLVASGPNSAMGILTSRTCLKEVMEKLNLVDRWKISKSAALTRLSSSVGVSVDKNGFLKVSATVESPELAQEILDAMRKHLDRRASELTLNIAKRNRELVGKTLEKAKEDVADVTEKVTRTLSSGPISNIEQLGKQYLDIKSKLADSKAAAVAASEEIAAQEEALKRTYSKGTGSNTAALELAAGEGVSKSMAVLAEELQKRRIEMKDVARKFTQQSPEYRAASRRLSDAETVADTELANQKKAVTQGTNSKLITAKAQLKALDASVEEYSRFARDFEEQLEEAPERYALTTVAQSEFTAALQRRAALQVDYDRALIAEMRDPARYEIVDPPEVEPDAVAPRKGMLAAIFFALAMAAHFLYISLPRGDSTANEIGHNQDQ